MNFDRVLIVAAHPDDDILGCGGFLSKFRGKAEFNVLFLCEGSTCRFDNITSPEAQQSILIRNQSARQALSSLGVEKIDFKNLPCGRLDQVPLIEINKIIEDSIKSFSPDAVFTHSLSDSNQDHIKIFRSSVIATRPKVGNSVKTLLSYEVLTSSEWSFSKSFQPNFFVSLSHQNVEDKWNSLSYFRSEIADYPYPRSREGIFTQSSYRGMQSGFHYSEAFQIIRAFSS